MPTTEQVQLIPLSKLHVSESNTRFPKATDPAIKELAKSLAAEQKTPILVRPHPSKKGHYEIAAGARRYTAALTAELKTLKAIVREYDDATFEETILTENLQREDPDPYAEAILLRKLLDRGQSLKEIAAALGKTDTWAIRRAKLAALDKDILSSWQKGPLKHFTAAMMEAIAALPECGQEKIAALIKEETWQLRRLSECESRAEVEGFLFNNITNSLDVPWLEDPRTFVEGCGPGCTHDSRKQGKLFDTEDRKGCGNCLNTSCFIKRRQLYIDAQYQKLSKGESLPVIARDSVEIQGQKYERDYSWQELSKTSKPNSEKVLVYENGTLSVAYKPGNPAKESKDKSQASPEEKIQNKIALHQGKRWVAVREKLVESLKEAALDKLTVPIDHLVAVFGLPYRVSSMHTAPADEGLWDYIHNPTAFPMREQGDYNIEFTGEDGPREEALWPSVKQVLLGLIPPPHRVSDAAKFEATYREISALIGFPIDTEKYKTDLEIPPPKSWGDVDPHTLQPK